MRRIAWCLVQRGDNQPLDLGIAHLARSPRPRLIQKDHRVGVPQSGYLMGDEGKGFKYILDGRELDLACVPSDTPQSNTDRDVDGVLQAPGWDCH